MWARSQAPGVSTERQPGSPTHPYPRPPAAPAQTRPVSDRAAVLNEDQVLQPVPGHVCEPNPRISKRHNGEAIEDSGGQHADLVPAPLR